jgi:Coenzyme PQQ synthesis protein D (PqqD).
MNRREFLKFAALGFLTLGFLGSMRLQELKAGNIAMNETGWRIYKGYKEGRTVEQIASDLTAEYNVDFETALKDTKEFIALLRSMGY